MAGDGEGYGDCDREGDRDRVLDGVAISTKMTSGRKMVEPIVNDESVEVSRRPVNDPAAAERT
jgi:hypothetical protein